MTLNSLSGLALTAALAMLPVTSALAGGNGITTFAGSCYSGSHINGCGGSIANAYGAPGVGIGGANNYATYTTNGSNTQIANKGITDATGNATNTTGSGSGTAVMMTRVISGGQHYVSVSVAKANANLNGASGSAAVRSKAW